MALNGVISNLLSLGANLLPFVTASAQAPSSSSSSPAESQQIKADLESLMKVLKRIKATLQDAEEREIRDKSVKLWLSELKEVAYDAEDVLDMYDYEVLRVQVEAREASAPNPRKRKQQVQLPDGMSEQIKQIKGRFDEICKHREDLQLWEKDGPRRCNSEWQIAPTGHFVVDSNIFGHEREREELIDLLSSKCHDGNVVSVVTVVGQGGVGKTTLAQLAYNNQRIRQQFSKFGWVCVSEDFNVQRLTRESIESITKRKCDLTNLSALQEKISTEIRGERVLLVLDDVWNENVNRWESLRAPFTSAALVKILVTTRNESVARIMQTVPTFNLSCLSEEDSWLLFQHHAFGRVNRYDDSKLVEVGKQIIKKCGMLPLAIKSIASLLRHEPEEENWKDVLESELWESDANNQIFAPLQISYTRLPTHLKPCFLYCSMFPKDYEYTEKELVALWISQGYIEPNGKRNKEKIGREYAKQLRHRSFFEDALNSAYFKLHDMVHDLARLNSENGCYSIEADKDPIFPEEPLYHLFVAYNVKLAEPLPASVFTSLRTVVCFGDKNAFSTVGFSKAQNLRALVLRRRRDVLMRGRGWLWWGRDCALEFCYSITNLKHLRYLSVEDLPLEMLPECICSLYHLRHLTLVGCYNLRVLPKSIGNLVSLEELEILRCGLQVLPVSFCQLKALTKLRLSVCDELEELPNDIGSLTNLQTLEVQGAKLRVLPVSFCQLKALSQLRLSDCDELEELPNDIRSLTNLQTLEIHLFSNFRSFQPNLSKFAGIQVFDVRLNCKTIGWLKDFVNLKGTLCLEDLDNVHCLTDVQCGNLLVSMHNLERLMLYWGPRVQHYFRRDEGSVLWLRILGPWMRNEPQRGSLGNVQGGFPLLDRLQPHQNLRELHIAGYDGVVFPTWVRNPTSCASLERVVIKGCKNLKFLPFGRWCKLKYLTIGKCSSLRFLPAESLPSELTELNIWDCHSLRYAPGIQKLTSLVRLDIGYCKNLNSLVTDTEPSIELTSSTNESLWGLRNLTSLRSLRIDHCHYFQPREVELLHVETCKVDVSHCRSLKEWCLQQKIPYKEGPCACYICLSEHSFGKVSKSGEAL